MDCPIFCTSEIVSVAQLWVIQTVGLTRRLNPTLQVAGAPKKTNVSSFIPPLDVRTWVVILILTTQGLSASGPEAGFTAALPRKQNLVFRIAEGR